VLPILTTFFYCVILRAETCKKDYMQLEIDLKLRENNIVGIAQNLNDNNLQILD
jgi:hypothetical protein